MLTLAALDSSPIDNACMDLLRFRIARRMGDERRLPHQATRQHAVTANPDGRNKRAETQAGGRNSADNRCQMAPSTRTATRLSFARCIVKGTAAVAAGLCKQGQTQPPVSQQLFSAGSSVLEGCDGCDSEPACTWLPQGGASWLTEVTTSSIPVGGAAVCGMACVSSPKMSLLTSRKITAQRWKWNRDTRAA